MRIREVASNFVVAFSTQGISMILSFITSLVVPKLLGVTEFGYWQLFMFYTTYCGISHLGLNDGVYLINGGKTRKTLDKSSIKSQFTVAFLLQMVFAIIILAVALLGGFGQQRAFVIFFTGIYMVLTNLTSFLGMVFQAINETKLYSVSTIVDRVIFLVPLIILLVLRVNQFELYVVFYAISKVFALAFCLWKAKDILSAHTLPFNESIHAAIRSIKVGINLMIANFASLLILGVARFAIDSKWGIAVFGKLSLSLSLVNFFITFVAQASIVLFPALRQSKTSELRRIYERIRDVMELVFPVIYVLYFPISWLLKLWLPEYAESLRFFILLIPICLFDAKMDVSCTTYFKVLRKEKVLLKVNLATALLSSIGVVLFTVVWPSVYLVIGSVTAAIILRSFVSEILIGMELDVKFSIISVEEIALTVVFIALAFTLPSIPAALSYVAVYSVFVAANRKAVKELASTIGQKLVKNESAK